MSDVSISSHLSFMKKAAELALHACGRSSPNPAVGALIVNPQGRIIGQGFTQAHGHNHAEVMAILQAQREFPEQELKSCSIYVTLEPCFHFGKTPPCVDLILKHGFEKVFIAMQDYNSLVSGRSIEKLRANHVLVEMIRNREIDDRLFFSQGGFLYRQNYSSPRYFLKWAQYADGTIGFQDRPSGAISGMLSQKVLMQLRKIFNANLTGPNTVKLDNPGLDIRNLEVLNLNSLLDLAIQNLNDHNTQGYYTKNQIRYFLIPHFDEQFTIQSLQNFLEKQKTIGESFFMFCSSAEQCDFLQQKNIAYEFIENYSEITSYLQIIEQQGINDLLIECGAGVLQVFTQRNAIDHLAVFLSPRKPENQGKTTSLSIALSAIAHELFNREYELDTISIENLKYHVIQRLFLEEDCFLILVREECYNQYMQLNLK